jgi:integrase
MARKSLSDHGVKSLKPKAARYALPDPELSGHYVRVQPTGAKSFVALARSPEGKQIWTTLGAADLLTIDEARAKARGVIRRVRASQPAFEERVKVQTFADVADLFVQRHVIAKGLVSRKGIEGLLRRHVTPRWGEREFESIRRGDVTAMLDRVEDDHGTRQADLVLAIIRKMANWWELRNEDYTSPIVRGMQRGNPKATARKRTLDHEEIRAVWKHAETAGQFGAIVRLALVTAQRREKIGSMRWADISSDGVWTVPSADRQKGVGGALQLPEVARKIIAEQVRLGDNPFVFPGRGDNHFTGWSRAKAAFDKAVPIAHWVVHDLRRTARTLMADAGIRPDIAERVMGHAILGVEATYDRSKYQEAKGAALKQLAAIIAHILNPADNVVPLTPGQ